MASLPKIPDAVIFLWQSAALFKVYFKRDRRAIPEGLGKEERSVSISLYTDRRLTAMYDTLNPWGRCEDFHDQLAGPERRTILDVGCGTGRLVDRDL